MDNRELGAPQALFPQLSPHWGGLLFLVYFAQAACNPHPTTPCGSQLPHGKPFVLWVWVKILDGRVCPAFGS